MLSYKATPPPLHVQYFSNFSAYQKPLEGLLEQTVDSTNCISDSAKSREVLRICILTEAWDFFFPSVCWLFKDEFRRYMRKKVFCLHLSTLKFPLSKNPAEPLVADRHSVINQAVMKPELKVRDLMWCGVLRHVGGDKIERVSVG